MNDKEIIMIRPESATRKLSEKQEEKMMNVLKQSFDDLFGEGDGENAEKY